MKTSTWSKRKTKTTLKDLFRIPWKWEKKIPGCLFLNEYGGSIASAQSIRKIPHFIIAATEFVSRIFWTRHIKNLRIHIPSIYFNSHDLKFVACFPFSSISSPSSSSSFFFLLDRMWDGKWLDSVLFYQLKLFDAVTLKCATDNEHEREEKSKKCTKKFVNIYGNKPIMFDIN